jgi:hypothetical protein
MTTTPGANKDRFLSVGWDMINLIENKINTDILEREEICTHHK